MAADLAEIGSLPSKNRGVKDLLFVIDILTKYARIKPLKNTKGKTVLNDFIEIVNKSKRKPNKLLADEGKQLYNNRMHNWLDDNDISMYSIHNEGKSIVAEMFSRTLQTIIYKTWHLGYLNELVDEYNNKYHYW